MKEAKAQTAEKQKRRDIFTWVDDLIDKIFSSPKMRSQTFLFGGVMIACAIVHFSFIILFALLGVRELLFFNTFSVCLYIALFCLFTYSPSWVVIFAAYLEICLHSSYATVLLGWESGFPMYLVCIAPLVFFYPRKRLFEPYLYSFLTMLLFIGLRVFSHNNEPIYPEIRESWVILPTGIYNTVVSFIMVLAFSAFCTSMNERNKADLMVKNEQLLQLANIDPLTHLLNRRSMRDYLTEAAEMRQLQGTEYCVLLCDVDDFKFVNDNFGHDCGDAVLRGIADTISRAVGEHGTVCRWGGEEFLILLPDTTGGDAYRRAEIIRSQVQATDITYDENAFNATITVGVASSTEFPRTDELISGADRRMYRGKGSGKNQVVYK